MKERYFKKVLIIGIIIVFFSASFTSSISGSGDKNIYKIDNKESVDFSLNNDFINAFWKFNECSGNIVADSSIHDYDGERYGATWTTGGQSGCALIFDGIDDYVNLTSHSEGLGFNKTDDLIISFHFKSTSGNGGIIYSSTGIQNIPEFKIELLTNGSILFKVWTSLCGISLCTGGGFNNGQWHFVEIYFNGITTNPTIEIYINETLKASITDWLCDIESSDFLKTNI